MWYAQLDVSLLKSPSSLSIVHDAKNRSKTSDEELTNRNGHVIKLFKCDLLIISLTEVSDFKRIFTQFA